jgi:hypothetical protein
MPSRKVLLKPNPLSRYFGLYIEWSDICYLYTGFFDIRCAVWLSSGR